MKRTLSVLGSSGSIGRQTLTVAEACGHRVAALTVNRSAELAEAQARQFRPRLAVAVDRAAADDLRVRLSDTETKVLAGEEGLLEFDGVSVETGPMDENGLTPASAVPALLEAVRSGYITACALEEEGTLLRVDCGDPAGSPGTGTETALWFDASTHALVRGEISVDGFRVILCEFSDFTAG